MFKLAYAQGVMQALLESGIKLSAEDAHLLSDQANQDNPAEMLASMFQEGVPSPVTSPDNKTKTDEGPVSESEPHWGAVQPGSTGAEGLQRSVQDFHMPGISSI